MLRSIILIALSVASVNAGGTDTERRPPPGASGAGAPGGPLAPPIDTNVVNTPRVNVANTPMAAVFLAPVDGNTPCTVLLVNSASVVESEVGTGFVVVTPPNRRLNQTAIETESEKIQYILELLIRVNGLSLTPANFLNASTGEYVCTNTRLYRLMGRFGTIPLA